MNIKHLVFLSLTTTSIGTFAMDPENMKKHDAFVMRCSSLEQWANEKRGQLVNSIQSRIDNNQCGFDRNWLIFQWAAFTFFAKNAHNKNFADHTVSDFLKDEQAWWHKAGQDFNMCWGLPTLYEMPEAYNGITATNLMELFRQLRPN